MMKKTSVLIADTQRLFADALGDALRAAPNVVVLAHRPSMALDTLKLAIEHRPDVVLLDYWLTGISVGLRPRHDGVTRSWATSPDTIDYSFHLRRCGGNASDAICSKAS